MRVFIILIVTAFTTGALAQCPKNPAISEELDEAYRSLKFAKFPRDAQVATDVLWALGQGACGEGGEYKNDETTHRSNVVQSGHLSSTEPVLWRGSKHHGLRP